MRADRLEQVFVKRAGAGFGLLLVLESGAGGRERVTLAVPPSVAASEAAAVEYLVRWLTAGGYGLASLVRVRRERGGQLADAPELRRLLLSGVAAAEADVASGPGGASGRGRG